MLFKSKTNPTKKPKSPKSAQKKKEKKRKSSSISRSRQNLTCFFAFLPVGFCCGRRCCCWFSTSVLDPLWVNALSKHKSPKAECSAVNHWQGEHPWNERFCFSRRSFSCLFLSAGGFKRSQPLLQTSFSVPFFVLLMNTWSGRWCYWKNPQSLTHSYGNSNILY